MNAVLYAMIISGVLYAAIRGKLDAVSQAALNGGGDALRLILQMTGGFMLFGGAVHILEKAGVMAWLVRALRRPLRWLFPEDPGEEAMEAVTENLAANMLGVSNAATPMGVRAARAMNPAGEKSPSAALCLFLVINATSVQILPTSVLTLRQAAGSAQPERIVLPSLIASAVSTALGILLCKLLERRKRTR